MCACACVRERRKRTGVQRGDVGGDGAPPGMLAKSWEESG